MICSLLEPVKVLEFILKTLKSHSTANRELPDYGFTISFPLSSENLAQCLFSGESLGILSVIWNGWFFIPLLVVPLTLLTGFISLMASQTY